MSNGIDPHVALIMELSARYQDKIEEMAHRFGIAADKLDRVYNEYVEQKKKHSLLMRVRDFMLPFLLPLLLFGAGVAGLNFMKCGTRIEMAGATISAPTCPVNGAGAIVE